VLEVFRYKLFAFFAIGMCCRDIRVSVEAAVGFYSAYSVKKEVADALSQEHLHWLEPFITLVKILK